MTSSFGFFVSVQFWSACSVTASLTSACAQLLVSDACNSLHADPAGPPTLQADLGCPLDLRSWSTGSLRVAVWVLLVGAAG